MYTVHRACAAGSLLMPQMTKTATVCEQTDKYACGQVAEGFALGKVIQTGLYDAAPLAVGGNMHRGLCIMWLRSLEKSRQGTVDCDRQVEKRVRQNHTAHMEY